MAVVGIDLGTTNSLVSVYKGDGVKLIPNSFGEYLTPSIVSFDKNGQFYVGKVAKERLITQPEVTFKEFKREMGTEKVYTVYKNQYRAEELSSFVLRQLKEDAEKYLGEQVTEAVISVPAYFNDKQRAATRSAGWLAGLKVDRLINEPSAAALAYRDIGNGMHQTLVVYDFGGGTLDVSLVDMFENIVEIQAVSGDNKLGGKDFNEIIVRDFCIKNDLNFNRLTPNKRAILYRECEGVKLRLTKEDKVTQTITLNKKAYEYTLSNQELINLSTQLFKRMVKPLQRVINDAEIVPQDISKVIMVGGSSKMPIVRKYIESLFEWNIDNNINPDEIVALGSGIVAGIKEREETIKDIVLSDICPFSLGVGIVGEVMSSIISKNQILPCSRVERYVTSYDYQKEIEFKVYQGENLHVANNLLLDCFRFIIPPKPEGEVYIDIRFSYDINGIFDIDMQSPYLKQDIHRSITNKSSGLSEEEIQIRQQELNAMKIHPRDMQENKYIMEKAKRLYEECNQEQQILIKDALKKFEKILDKQDLAKVRPAYVEFAVKLKMIESTVFRFSGFEDLYLDGFTDEWNFDDRLE